MHGLPSESEWEYAARGGTTTKYSWGDAIGANRANWGGSGESDNCGDRFANAAPVGSFRANALGLYDMHGNVWEWVADCWNGGYARAPGDGSAWLSGNCDMRVLRGGSWDFVPRDLRAAFRSRFTSDYRSNLNGSRVARTLTP